MAGASPTRPGRELRMRLLTESELDGHCKGWDGATTFRLLNGEVWEQAAFRVRHLHLACPAVRIWHIAGASLLELEGARELLPVRRRA